MAEAEGFVQDGEIAKNIGMSWNEVYSPNDNQIVGNMIDDQPMFCFVFKFSKTKPYEMFIEFLRAIRMFCLIIIIIINNNNNIIMHSPPTPPHRLGSLAGTMPPSLKLLS